MSDQITIMASIRPKPECFEICKQTLLELQIPTLKEPGCLQFDIFESEPANGKIYFFERFKDQASFDLHFSYDYTQAVFEKYKDWLAEDLQIVQLKKAA